MKNLMLPLLFTVISVNAFAHDMYYTIVQDGGKQVQSCRSKDLGAQVNFFKSSSRGAGYIILSSSDEDTGTTVNHISSAKISTKGHDVEVYSNEELTAELVMVGEGDLPGTIKLGAKNSALRVWLKTHGQGFDLKKAKLDCTAL